MSNPETIEAFIYRQRIKSRSITYTDNGQTYELLIVNIEGHPEIQISISPQGRSMQVWVGHERAYKTRLGTNAL